MTYRILAIALLLSLSVASCGKSEDKTGAKKAAATSKASKDTDQAKSAGSDNKTNTADKKQNKSELDGSKLSEIEKRSYLYGIEMGRQMRMRLPRDNKFDTKTFLVGVKDSMQGNQMALNDAQIKAVIKGLQEEHIANLKKRYKTVIDAGDKFLADIKKKPGVVEDTSGILYKVVRKGTGPSPTLKDKVKVHYTGLRIDGKQFDSSVARGKPVTFDLSQRGLIKGWLAALPKMKEGARWKIYVPSKLAYGWRGAPGIRPFETLVFNIELIKINPKPPAPVAAKKPAAKKPEKPEAAKKPESKPAK